MSTAILIGAIWPAAGLAVAVGFGWFVRRGQ